jgi:hypothetical protein
MQPDGLLGFASVAQGGRGTSGTLERGEDSVHARPVLEAGRQVVGGDESPLGAQVDREPVMAAEPDRQVLQLAAAKIS